MRQQLFKDLSELVDKDSLNQFSKKYLDSKLVDERITIAQLGDDEALDSLIKDKDYEVRVSAASVGRDIDSERVLKDKSYHVRESYVKNAEISQARKFIKDKNKYVIATLASRNDKDLRKFIIDKIVEGVAPFNSDVVVESIARVSPIPDLVYLYEVCPQFKRQISYATMYLSDKERLELIIHYFKDDPGSTISIAKRLLSKLN